MLVCFNLRFFFSEVSFDFWFIYSCFIGDTFDARFSGLVTWVHVGVRLVGMFSNAFFGYVYRFRFGTVWFDVFLFGVEGCFVDRVIGFAELVEWFLFSFAWFDFWAVRGVEVGFFD